MTPTNGKDELFHDFVYHCTQITKELETTDDVDMDELHKQVGGVLCMLDLLMEHGVLTPMKIQNNKIYKRISFNETRQFNMERVIIIPNFSPPPSIWRDE